MDETITDGAQTRTETDATTSESTTTTTTTGADLIESELLVEEISIDGMCGVY